MPTLQGQVVANLFFEPSTRTRSSFELAAKRLSADTLNFSPSGSSLSKGETILDTAKTYLAMGADLMVIRHRGSRVSATIAQEMDRLGAGVELERRRWPARASIPSLARFADDLQFAQS